MKLSGITKIFSDNILNDGKSTVTENIVVYVINIIVRQDLIINLIDEFNNNRPYDKAEKNQKLIQIYLSLEDFIIKNKPLVVKQEYTRESLHEEIRRNFDISRIPDNFRLVFLPEKEQLFTLYCLYTKVLTDYITEQIGKEEVNNVISKVYPGTFFTDFSTNDGQLISIIYQKIATANTLELAQIFNKINTELYKKIAESFGENTAFDITEKSYNNIKDTYGYYLISQYLQVVPDGVLDRERVTFMTRDELEKQAMNATKEEKLRREMAEKLANNLKQENTIIEEKVHEQTSEILKEKEALKKAIETININYAQAERNEAKLLASVKSLSLGFILTDINNNITIFNESAKRILKISDEINSINAISIKFKNNKIITENIEKTRRENVPVIFEEVTIHDQFLNITITPVSLPEPKLEYIGAAIIIDDITEEKRLERTKDEFFAIASHELRTPLTSIRGAVTLLRDYYRDELEHSEMTELVAMIEKSSGRLISIVNQFLDVSLLELGRVIFNFENFNINSVIKESIEDMSGFAKKKNLSISFDQTDQIFNVYADRERTKQILENLISNGIKFTEKGGIEISVYEKDNHILIRIKDTGQGIKSDSQGLLFQKFRQADDILTHDATKGTGLGLYISRKLVDNMSGSIYLESSVENRGSSFVFLLPKASNSKPSLQ